MGADVSVAARNGRASWSGSLLEGRRAENELDAGRLAGRFRGSFTGVWFRDLCFETDEGDGWEPEATSAAWKLAEDVGTIEGKGWEATGEPFSFQGEYDALGRFVGTKRYADRTVKYVGRRTSRMLAGQFSLGRRGREGFTWGAFFLVPGAEPLARFANFLRAFAAAGGEISFGVATYGRWLGAARDELFTHLGSGGPPAVFERLRAERSHGCRTQDGEAAHWERLRALDALVRASGYAEECALGLTPILRAYLER